MLALSQTGGEDVKPQQILPFGQKMRLPIDQLVGALNEHVRINQPALRNSADHLECLSIVQSFAMAAFPVTVSL